MKEIEEKLAQTKKQYVKRRTRRNEERKVRIG